MTLIAAIAIIVIINGLRAAPPERQDASPSAAADVLATEIRRRPPTADEPVRKRSPTARERVKLLQSRGGQSATLGLIELLTSKDHTAAIAAAHALGELRDIRAVEPLKDTAHNHRSRAVRNAAEDALRKLWHIEE